MSQEQNADAIPTGSAMDLTLNAVDSLSRLAIRTLLLLALSFPLAASLLYLCRMGSLSLPVGHSFAENLLYVTLNKLDSGGQMAMGPNILRFLILMAGVILTAVPRPLERSWRFPLLALALFHLVSLISAGRCDHVFDALLCCLDAVAVSLMIWLPSSQWLPQDVPRLAILFTAVGVCTIPTDFSQMMGDPAQDGQMRGSFFHPTMMSSYLLLGLPVLLTLGLHRPLVERWMNDEGGASDTRVLRGMLLAVAAASMSCLILSGSRATYLSALIGITFFLSMLGAVESGRFHPGRTLGRAVFAVVLVGCAVLLIRSGLPPLTSVVLLAVGWMGLCPRLALKLGLLLAMTVLFVVLAQQQAAYNKKQAPVVRRVEGMVSGNDDSSSARVAFWRAGLQISQDYPVLGVGPEGFHRYYPQYQGDVRWFSKFAHSTPLSILVETGWVGLLSFFLACLLLFRLAVRTLVDELDPVVRVVRFALLVGCAGFAMGTLVDVQFQFPVLPLSFGFCLGLALIGEPAPLPLAPPQNAWTLRPSIVSQQLLAGLLLVAWAANVMTLPADYYIMVSRMATTQKRNKEAAVLAEEACRLCPYQGEYFHQLGLDLMAEYSQLDERQKKLLHWAGERAVALDGHRAVHYDLMSKVFLGEKRPQEALEYALRAIECDPVNYANFYFSVAQIQTSLGRLNNARDILQACVVRFPADSFGKMFDFRSSALNAQMAEIYHFLGELEDPTQHFQSAEGYYRKALHFNPNLLPARMGLATALFWQERYADVVSELETVLYQNDRDENALKMLIYSNDHLGNRARAAELQQRLQKLKVPASSP